MTLNPIRALLGLGKFLYKWITSPAGKQTLKVAEAIIPTLKKVAEKKLTAANAGQEAIGIVQHRLAQNPDWAIGFVKFQQAVDAVKLDYPELKDSQVHAAVEAGVNSMRMENAGATNALALVMAFALCSCQVIHGNASKGTYTYASLGGDAKGFAQTSQGVTAESLDTSTSFREGNKTARNFIWADAAKSVANSLTGAYQSTRNAKTAAGVETAKSADAVKTAEIQAKTAETAILNPAP